MKLSVLGAAPDASMRFSRAHHAAEEAIAGSGLGWTFLRPNGFMQNTLRWAAQIPGGTIAEPVPDARWSIVDARDVAAVAVAALTDPAIHAGRAYTLTGPEASSPREQAAVVGDLLARPIAVEDVGIDAAVAWLRGSGAPEWTAEGLGELFRFYADGHGEAVSGDVEAVTGRPPGGFRRFAEEHRQAFGA